MNRQEVIKLIRVLSVNYRGWPEEGKEADTVALWERMLADVPYDVGQAAVMAYISRSPYPPTIADIREAVRSLTTQEMTAMEAWQMVTDAIRRFGYYREKEALESLPPDVADMVQRFGWQELCTSEEPEVVRAQWRMAWENQQKHKREFDVLPSEVKALVEAQAERLRMPSGKKAPELKSMEGETIDESAKQLVQGMRLG